jgi:hypothetical protein
VFTWTMRRNPGTPVTYRFVPGDATDAYPLAAGAAFDTGWVAVPADPGGAATPTGPGYVALSWVMTPNGPADRNTLAVTLDEADNPAGTGAFRLLPSALPPRGLWQRGYVRVRAAAPATNTSTVQVTPTFNTSPERTDAPAVWPPA